MTFDPLDALPFDDGPIHEPTAEERDPTSPAGDPFFPPSIATLVHCIHCDQEYDSFRIEWRIDHDASGRPHGRWCCPVAGCDGAGFGFDIFPVDPDWQDPDGRGINCCFFDEGDDEPRDDDATDDSFDTGEIDWLFGGSDEAWRHGDHDPPF